MIAGTGFHYTFGVISLSKTCQRAACHNPVLFFIEAHSHYNKHKMEYLQAKPLDSWQFRQYSISGIILLFVRPLYGIIYYVS